MTDNLSNDELNSATDSPAIHDLYSRPDYVKFMHAALCGLLEVTDDSDLGYDDGRQNVVQVQLMDALAFTAHKQLEFHQRVLEQDVERYRRFLTGEYAPNNEILDQKDERFQQQILRHQKALGIYDVLKAQAVALYLNITGLPEWKPFNERQAKTPPTDKLVSAKLAMLSRQFPVKPPAETPAAAG